MTRFILVTCVTIAILGPGGGPISAQDRVASTPPALRTWGEKQALLGPTRAQQIEQLRVTVRSGRHSGQPRLVNMFKNFDGAHALDPTVPGVTQALGMTASPNPSQVKGASRTVAYAQRLNQDGRFRLLGLDRKVQTALGRTDHDIRYRHQTTGQAGMIEVKDLSLRSQRSSLGRIKLQMEKHALYARQNGELPPVWVNRRAVHPELKAHAQKVGIVVRGDVKSGSFQETVLNGVHGHATAQARVRALHGGMRAGVGLLLLYQAGVDLQNDIRLYGTKNQGAPNTVQIAEHAAILVVGGSSLASGAILTVDSLKPALQLSSRLAGVSKWSGRLGAVGAVAAGGLIIWQWQSGAISDRQFASASAGLLGGVGGGMAGVWVGTSVGAVLGGAVGSVVPGAGTAAGAVTGGKIGAWVGGFAGAYAGSSLAGGGTATYFRLKDAEQERQLDEFVYRYYAAR